jgi:hypothetical protein
MNFTIDRLNERPPILSALLTWLGAVFVGAVGLVYGLAVAFVFIAPRLKLLPIGQVPHGLSLNGPGAYRILEEQRNVTPSDLDTYLRFAIIGLAIAAAVSFVLLLESDWPWLLKGVYVACLLVLLPLSGVNPAFEDMPMKYSVQVGLDSATAAVGLAAAILLWRLKPFSEGEAALRALALFFVLFQGTFLPAFMARLWQHSTLASDQLLMTGQAKSFIPHAVAGIAAVPALCIAIFRYTRDINKLDASAH